MQRTAGLQRPLGGTSRGGRRAARRSGWAARATRPRETMSDRGQGVRSSRRRIASCYAPTEMNSEGSCALRDTNRAALDPVTGATVLIAIFSADVADCYCCMPAVGLCGICRAKRLAGSNITGKDSAMVAERQQLHHSQLHAPAHRCTSMETAVLPVCRTHLRLHAWPHPLGPIPHLFAFLLGPVTSQPKLRSQKPRSLCHGWHIERFEQRRGTPHCTSASRHAKRFDLA